MKRAVILRTHIYTDWLLKNNQQLIESCKKLDYDFYIVYDATGRKPIADENVINVSEDMLELYCLPAVTTEEYTSLPARNKPKKSAFWYNTDYITLLFWELTSRKYDQVYSIEYDLYLNGDWAVLLKKLEEVDADLLAIGFRRYENSRNKDFFKTLNFQTSNMAKIFGIFNRFSRALLETLVTDYKLGKRGYYEVLLPTVALSNGLSVKDLEEYMSYSMNSMLIQYADSFSRDLIQSMLKDRRYKNHLLHPIKHEVV